MSLRITGHVYLFQHEQAAPGPLLQVPALQVELERPHRHVLQNNSLLAQTALAIAPVAEVDEVLPGGEGLI
jgi:hypothetical protein